MQKVKMNQYEFMVVTRIGSEGLLTARILFASIPPIISR